MKSIEASRIPVVYPAGERATADWIAAACARALDLTWDLWGLPPPPDCRIYVMTSWPGFVFGSAPWPWRILLASAFPVWAFRARRTWPYSGAWTQNYGRRVAIGIKPPRLLQGVPEDARVRVTVTEDDPNRRTQQLACHELVHACAAHLRLPMWLNEGIAMVTVDRFAGRMMIRPESLAYLRESEPKGRPPTYRELSRMSLDAIAGHWVRAYWLVRYLEDTRPGLLRTVFAQAGKATHMEDRIAAELRVAPECMWSEMSQFALDYFSAFG